jgi:outer membrane protein assembly factor BamB
MLRYFDKLILGFICSLILFSCQNNGENVINDSSDEAVPVVSCDIAFREEDKAGGVPCSRPILDGDILYVLENATTTANAVLAFDLKNQKKLWRTYPYKDQSDWENTGKFCSDFCLSGDSLWVPFYFNNCMYLMQIHITDGSRGKTIYIKSEQDVYTQGFNITMIGSKIFFFSHQGICYCDTQEAISLDSQKDLVQCDLHTAYQNTSSSITGLLFQNIDNDFLLSYRNTDDYSNCGMIRFNPTTMQKVWEINGEDFIFNYTVNNGKILSTVISYTTPGEAVKRFVAYDVNTGAYIGKYESGIFRDTYPLCIDNKIIQTSNVNTDDNGKPMVYCLNANTLKLIWKKDVNLKNLSSGSNCQANNGIVYYPRSSGMWLYDLETGRTLGKDQSFQASDIYDSAFSFRYGNLLIIQNGEELLGIKMNFKKSASGLVKE